MNKSALLASCVALALAATSGQAATVTQTFGVGTSFDNGPGTVAFSLGGLDTNVISDISFDFAFIGDLNGRRESFEVFLDGVSYGIGCDNNTGNDSFGIDVGRGADRCRQRRNELAEASFSVSAADAVNLLADGALLIEFDFTAQVNDILNTSIGGETRAGVTFADANGVSFAVGGTFSYLTAPAAPIPVPPGLPLLATGLAAFGWLRMRQAG